MESEALFTRGPLRASMSERNIKIPTRSIEKSVFIFTGISHMIGLTTP